MVDNASDIELKYNITKEIVTNTVRLRLLSNGVVHYTYLPDSVVSEVEHQQNHNALVQFSISGEKLPVLIDANDFINLTPQARKLIRELEAIVPISKRALVIRSFSQRLLSNFYIKYHKPIVSTKIFESYEDAIKWLLS